MEERKEKRQKAVKLEKNERMKCLQTRDSTIDGGQHWDSYTQRPVGMLGQSIHDEGADILKDDRRTG